MCNLVTLCDLSILRRRGVICFKYKKIMSIFIRETPLALRSTIEDLKNFYQQRTGIPGHRLVFKFDGQELVDWYTLPSYGISENSRIYIYVLVPLSLFPSAAAAG